MPQKKFKPKILSKEYLWIEKYANWSSDQTV